ncbi:hypothetical protein SH528x_003198 [Novipirellula sp. SH528]|uniref:hypothetical protein n=1 Tax=Novipirellula sp. SH528 TaxID=3454466 RepID=UPI003FA132A5
MSAVLVAGVVLGTWAAWIGSFVCGAVLISQLITVFVGRDLLRAGAIGFLVPVSLYLACTAFISDKEYSF